ncbi:AraC family transcriptional regulator [Paenibacillus filicis]|uniref:AraC family transcriptional regulator n=2 Tax=Paenibacillus gyeongsangnamensis TaxID=3388067 RepID=A0ABT4QBG9_9BACL|nr:AraC family transcriptional regulator [Paenibacillus filicis]MCZ8514230.1 AraC family transcriptional regulator [Paenibacillus filicis]
MITDAVHLPFYVYTVGGMENQTPVSRPNGYLHYVWLHTIRGQGKLILDGKKHLLAPNTGVVLFPGSSYEYASVEEPWETHWVAFQGFAVHPFLIQNAISDSKVFTFQNLGRLDHHIHEIFLSALTNHPENGLISSGKLYSFLVEWIQCINRERQQSGESAYHRVQPVLAYMEQHLGEDLSLEELAAVIGSSPQYLCRMFKQSIQMSPVGYLIRLRLQKAKELLLENGDISVSEIGRNVGFHTSSYFCSVFRQHEGITPLEFRKSHR